MWGTLPQIHLLTQTCVYYFAGKIAVSKPFSSRGTYMYIVIVLQCICLQSSDCDTLSPSTDTPEPEIKQKLENQSGE